MACCTCKSYSCTPKLHRMKPKSDRACKCSLLVLLGCPSKEKSGFSAISALEKISVNNQVRFSGEKNVGVPPPRCNSLISGFSSNKFRYKSHSFSTVSMYGFSTSCRLVILLWQAQNVHKLSQNGKCMYKEIPSSRLLSRNDWVTDFIHNSVLKLLSSQYGTVG